MSFEVFWPLLVAVLVPLGIWRVQWAANKAEKGNEERDRRLAELQEDVHRLELQVAGDLPKKDDLNEIKRDVEAIRSIVGELRDMVIRLDAKGNG